MRIQSGYTMIELLMVVLIVGLLASIAVPSFNGQRNRAKNASAQVTLRTSLLAARAYYSQPESFTGLDNPKLAELERSLSDQAPSVLTPGPNADPTKIDITVLNGGDGVRLCNVSKGNATFCLTFDGKKVYYHSTSGSVAATSATGGSSNSWGALSNSSSAQNPVTYGTLGPTLGADDASGERTLIEAEDFMNDCGVYSGAVSVCHNYQASTNVTLSQSASYLRVRASASQCATPGANMRVYIDNVLVLDKMLMTTDPYDLNWYEYKTSAPLSAGTHTLRAGFYNDWNPSPTCDRNLFIDKFEIFQTAP
jgi:prepilin-type N-terminal cleavage/methylation domain-containing protein